MTRSQATLETLESTLTTAGFTCHPNYRTDDGGHRHPFLMVFRGGAHYGNLVAGDNGAPETCTGLRFNQNYLLDILRAL